MGLGKYIQQRLWSVTSDPASLSDGDIWYRSDIKAIRARSNSVTESLFPAGGQYPNAGYYLVSEGARLTLSMVSITEYAIPIWLLRGGTAVRIGAEVTAGGTAGTVIRLGIRADSGAGLPGTLILDAGTISGVTVAAAEITISQALNAGLYWLTATAQSTGATLPTVRASSGGISPGGANTLASALGGTAPAGFQTGGSVSGALGSSFTPVQRTGGPPVIALRF